VPAISSLITGIGNPQEKDTATPAGHALLQVSFIARCSNGDKRVSQY
jgi:hypothetical protein